MAMRRRCHLDRQAKALAMRGKFSGGIEAELVKLRENPVRAPSLNLSVKSPRRRESTAAKAEKTERFSGHRRRILWRQTWSPGC